MEELLKTFIVHKSSQESFYSSHSQPDSPTVTPSTQSNSDATTKTAGLPIYDVETYLQDPRNQSLLTGSSTNSPSKGTETTHGPFTGPVQLGAPKTSHYVPSLYRLCLGKGVVPEYEIEGDPGHGFGGTLKLGNEIITSEERRQNKKEAKEMLAGKAIPTVRQMFQAGRDIKSVTTTTTKEKNWVGMLL
ncbi:MAG: hypothetical protein Q9190_002237, partial [Brigantiaea leucoxantha]